MFINKRFNFIDFKRFINDYKDFIFINA